MVFVKQFDEVKVGQGVIAAPAGCSQRKRCSGAPSVVTRVTRNLLLTVLIPSNLKSSECDPLSGSVCSDIAVLFTRYEVKNDRTYRPA